MTVIQGYTQSVLLPQLRSLALSKRQREIVLEDVSRRLESLLFHWNDLAFRRTILIWGPKRHPSGNLRLPAWKPAHWWLLLSETA